MLNSALNQRYTHFFRCGPHKLATILIKCIDRFDDSSENRPSLTSHLPFSGPNTIEAESQKQTSFPTGKRPDRLSSDLPVPSKATTPKPRTSMDMAGENNGSLTPTVEPAAESPPAGPMDVLPIRTASSEPHVLVTDDNAINRKVPIFIKLFNRLRRLTYCSF